jgi:hypothetical protein
MPLTAKGEKIEAAMKKEYGAEKGEAVLYASRNAGKISGIDAAAARLASGEYISGRDRKAMRFK